LSRAKDRLGVDLVQVIQVDHGVRQVGLRQELGFTGAGVRADDFCFQDSLSLVGDERLYLHPGVEHLRMQ